ncbi:hypothetical protein TTHERM_000141009 (macronuclear) [Tetrahymena thermophila SB210]|uniref:Uncharacterized protein n=1 Tax=Tetrahymena thermophila (strain SB210) TaxID=312017 RepID=W7XDJ4_TETTS|nr:hypothetical protein TTHERM_000141009 [Tetrahymena thermophila SB210]EWS75642.1 hypothetical protein TTHERM_000141009 [Tetrahymena thermophila SB210]|eukprot:XP_012651788.1 hypothetical protein TTHERM_000141009 [Tetrahymena thermophila SB210]
MSTFLGNQEKTVYIEDVIQQQKPQKNNISPYLTDKDRERGFFPSCRTDRFDWQKNNAMLDLNTNKKPAQQQEQDTQGKWNKLIMKTENERVSRRCITPNSNTYQSSQRVLNPNLLGTPKFEGIKVYKNQINDNWQKRRQDGHEKAIEFKHQKNIDQYIPNEFVIPNTEGREKRDFSRLGRTEFSNREQISQILVDKSLNNICDDSKISKSLTPDRCLYQKTHLKSGLIPTEERNEMQRINRSKSQKQQGGQIKYLLTDNSSIISNNTNNTHNTCSVEKISKKYVNKQLKHKINEESKDFWKDMTQNDVWKEEIQLRNEFKYGRNCTREYILQENPMFKEGSAQSYLDFISETNLKTDLQRKKQNTVKTTQQRPACSKSPQNKFQDNILTNTSSANYSQKDLIVENRVNSKSPFKNSQKEKSEIHSVLSYRTCDNNQQKQSLNYKLQSEYSKSPSSKFNTNVLRNSIKENLTYSKSPARNSFLTRSETHSNLNLYKQNQHNKQVSQLSKSPSARIITNQEYPKLQSKSPSRYQSNNTYSKIYSSNNSNNQQKNQRINNEQQNARQNSKSPSQVSQRAPLSQVNNNSNKQIYQNRPRQQNQQNDDNTSIKSIVQNLFQEKSNYQNQQNRTQKDNNDNFSILSYSVSQIGGCSKEQQSPIKKYGNKSCLNEGILFYEDSSVISHISKLNKSQVSQITTQNKKIINQNQDKENVQFASQTVKKQREMSKSPRSSKIGSSQVGSLLKHF